LNDRARRWCSAATVAYAVAYTGPQHDSAAVCSVQMVRSGAETSIAASFKTAAFVHSATPPTRDSSVGPWTASGAATDTRFPTGSLASGAIAGLAEEPSAPSWSHRNSPCPQAGSDRGARRRPRSAARPPRRLRPASVAGLPGWMAGMSASSCLGWASVRECPMKKRAGAAGGDGFSVVCQSLLRTGP
jgi:hypothetical protein